MRQTGTNLSEWARRLGFRRDGWTPDFAETVQPVQVVSDASALVPPLLPPTQLRGSGIPTTVGRFACAQVRARSAGGCYVRLAEAVCVNINSYSWRIGPPIALTATFAANAYEIGPTPLVSTIEIGEVAASALTTGDPRARVGANVRYTWPDLIYVPPGLSWYAESVTVSVALEWAIIAQDVPASVPPP